MNQKSSKISIFIVCLLLIAQPVVALCADDFKTNFKSEVLSFKVGTQGADTEKSPVGLHFIIKEDSTAAAEKSLPTSSDDITGSQYTPEQDSNFFRDSRLSFSFMYWLKKGLEASQSQWADILQYNENLPGNALKTSFSLMPANVFEPTTAETVQHMLSRHNALSVPTVRSYWDDIGMQFNIRDIGVLIGAIEDVSPKITYTLTLVSDVEIVIYSVSAVQVATIFSGTQRAGKYTLYWNGKDDAGKRMPAGDYIAEVKVGQERFVRKRIVIE